MINFFAFTPHPPIIVPQVGKENLSQVKRTVAAMKKLAEICERKNPKNLIVVSPHGLVFSDEINLVSSKNLYGDFAPFGAPEVNFRFQNNLDLVSKFKELAITAHRHDFHELDYGTLVPLYYLTRNIKPKIISMSYSWQDASFHWQFGEKIGVLLNEYPQTCGLVASGDLSHRLFQSKTGLEFDLKIKSILERRAFEKILEIDEEFSEEAGECGLRSLVILLGAISNFKNVKSEVLSYECPFGVGYLVSYFKIVP